MSVAERRETKTETTADTRKPLDVERLVEWAIARQLADKIVEWRDTPDRDREPSSWSGDGTGAVARFGLLGAKVDGSGPGGYATQSLHPDAELVYRTIQEFGRNERNLILDFARRGRRPKHSPVHVVQWEPLRWRYNGETGRYEATTWQVKERGQRRRGIRYCPMVLKDRAQELEHARWLYMSWHRAMQQLSDRLCAQANAFHSYRPLGFSAPEQPWQTGI